MPPRVRDNENARALSIACMVRSYTYVHKENESLEPNVLAGYVLQHLNILA